MTTLDSFEDPLPQQSGLVVPIPSLHAFTETWRPRVDKVPPVGVPAHVTVLYPFLDPDLVADSIDELTAFCASWPSFTYRLDGIGWFDNQVVFVKPHPADKFTELTDAIAERWGLAPYGGQILDPEPHVTIGFEGSDRDMERVAEAASDLLPIEDQRADQVWLMQGSPDPPRWTRTHRFDLAG